MCGCLVLLIGDFFFGLGFVVCVLLGHLGPFAPPPLGALLTLIFRAVDSFPGASSSSSFFFFLLPPTGPIRSMRPGGRVLHHHVPGGRSRCRCRLRRRQRSTSTSTDPTTTSKGAAAASVSASPIHRPVERQQQQQHANERRWFHTNKETPLSFNSKIQCQMKQVPPVGLVGVWRIQPAPLVI